LMLRMDGIPARIAAGFLPGSYDAATRQWVVRAVDAHSWVEVYFTGIGWVPFDPTPPRVAGTPQYPLFTSARAARITQMEAIAATVGAAPAAPAPTPRPRRDATGAGLPQIGALVAAAVVLLVLAALGGRWATGCKRLRRSLDGDCELATRELVQALRRLGYALPPTVTLTRVEAIVRVHAGEDGARYVRRLRDRRYAPPTDVSATLGDRRRLRRCITVRLGLDARLQGLRALPPGTLARGVRGHAGGP
jgi:protein-glutamine gamma-glutamyltransferase